MSTHTVRFNNFIKASNISTTDIFSKVFITIQWLLGLNRIGIICKSITLKVLTTLVTLLIISLVFFLSNSFIYSAKFDYYPEIVKLVQYTICAILCFASRNKLRQYYEELHKFDVEVECKPKVNRVTIVIFFSMFSILLSFVPIYSFHPKFVKIIPLHLVQIIENHYYGFLFNLLNQRLRLINRCIELSLLNNLSFSTNVEPITLKSDGNKYNLSMNKLMDLYYIIISAYDILIDAIKWQLLFIITTSFVYTLYVSYTFAVGILRGGYSNLGTLVGPLLVACDAFPLIVPCMCCDGLRLEVRRLRELLASKLFESKLDKSNRSVARALLALTKARDLSFSLLRMVDISISLPFSFVGLMATYLIILLQFQKVINPDDRIVSHSSYNNTTTGGY